MRLRRGVKGDSTHLVRSQNDVPTFAGLAGLVRLLGGRMAISRKFVLAKNDMSYRCS